MKNICRIILAFIGVAFLFWGFIQLPIWLQKFIVGFLMFCICIVVAVLIPTDK